MSSRHQSTDEFPPHQARTRVVTAFGFGLVVGGMTALVGEWHVAPLVGWCTAAAGFLLQVWLNVYNRDADWTASHATRLDESRFAADATLLAACLASLVAVGVLLVKAAQVGGAAEAAYTAIAVASVVLSWAVVHTVFALRYAHLYYGSGGGMNFHGNHPPTYRDFAYVAFTIGMTYQVSDTEVNARRMRTTVLRHALLSFLFGTAIIAMMINVVAGLVR